MQSGKALGNRHSELKVAVNLFHILHAQQPVEQLVNVSNCRTKITLGDVYYQPNEKLTLIPYLLHFPLGILNSGCLFVFAGLSREYMLLSFIFTKVGNLVKIPHFI